MLNVDLQKLLANGISRYELVSATAKRARMIVEDAEKNHDIIIDKPVSIAVKELEEGVWKIK
ncbi:MAG: DNA-directed RNA polymerase subunit omega [Clostridiales bacterium]|nr:DNA-directed RNA polymerase subunit omega [Clostridiales bacterium]MCD7828695.1 DNA-directed RNA polymerase subunit omega [Clostridiales bacterium]